MRTWMLSGILLSIALGASALEAYQFPHVFEKSSSPIAEENIAQKRSNPSAKTTPPKNQEHQKEKEQEKEQEKEGRNPPSKQATNIAEKIQLEDHFSPVAIQRGGFILSSGRSSPSLFQHTPVHPRRDLFYVTSFTLQKNGKVIGIVSDILPTETMSIGRLFSRVRKKLETAVTSFNSDEIWLSPPLKTAGEANFYLNDQEGFPDTIFLIARSSSKVLAFQYASDYHDTVLPSISVFFE